MCVPSPRASKVAHQGKSLRREGFPDFHGLLLAGTDVELTLKRPKIPLRGFIMRSESIKKSPGDKWSLGTVPKVNPIGSM